MIFYYLDTATSTVHAYSCRAYESFRDVINNANKEYANKKRYHIIPIKCCIKMFGCKFEDTRMWDVALPEYRHILKDLIDKSK